MVIRRPTKLNADELTLQGLNPYEIITLYSLAEGTVDKYQLALTKEGGLWPIILTELFLEYDLTSEDIERATKQVSTDWSRMEPTTQDLC